MMRSQKHDDRLDHDLFLALEKKASISVIRTCAQKLESTDRNAATSVIGLKSYQPMVDLLVRMRMENEQPVEAEDFPTVDGLFWLYPALETQSDTLKSYYVKKIIMETLAFRERARQASTINGHMFAVWDEARVKSLPTAKSHLHLHVNMFLDPDEEPRLSPEQQKRFEDWKRPLELFRTPVLIADPKGAVIDSNIRQSGFVSNCSFISSLLIMARHERKHTGFATQGLYPKNAKGVSVLSPSGKYEVRLFWNGEYRSVVIDDMFPVDKSDVLLCAHSGTSSGEIWASLMEKAYLKLVAGGYDLWTGSHSGIDLYALTGWPPETLLFNQEGINDDLWEKLIRGMKIKDNLVTASTRSDINEDTTGLSRGHSFAILAAKQEPSANGAEIRRRLLLRNPWAFATVDGQTEEEQGFWMDLREMPKLFQSVHVNWNIALFAHVSHRMCTLAPNERTDEQGFYRSIQYHVKPGPGTNLVWILLSRHVCSVTQLESVDNALACHAFAPPKNNQVQRIVFPQESKTLFQGKYSSGPHTLCRIEDPPEQGVVLVLASYAAKAPVNSTLSVFSTSKATTVRELTAVLDGGSIAGHAQYSTGGAGRAHLWLLRVPKSPAASSQGAFKIRASCQLSAIADAEFHQPPNPNAHPFIKLEFWMLDIKMSQKHLLGETEPRSRFSCLEVSLARELLSRTSVRFIVVPTLEGPLPSDVDHQDDALSYILEIQCDIPLAQLATPSDEQQQVLLHRMLSDFTKT